MQINAKPNGSEIKLTKRESDMLDSAKQLIELLGKHGSPSMQTAAGTACGAIMKLQYELQPEIVENDPLQPDQTKVKQETTAA
jgi:hypothetical protein